MVLTLALSALILIGAGPQPASGTTPHKLKPGDLYVSLGSSIASGYGIAVQSTSCGRSSVDYGQLVAKHFHLHLIDASCGAAVIDNVLTTPQGSNPPQLTFVTPATKLITVAVGGNDIVYNGTAVECDKRDHMCATDELRRLGRNHAHKPQGDDRKDKGSSSVSHDCLRHLPSGGAPGKPAPHSASPTQGQQ